MSLCFHAFQHNITVASQECIDKAKPEGKQSTIVQSIRINKDFQDATKVINRILLQGTHRSGSMDWWRRGGVGGVGGRGEGRRVQVSSLLKVHTKTITKFPRCVHQPPAELKRCLAFTVTTGCHDSFNLKQDASDDSGSSNFHSNSENDGMTRIFYVLIRTTRATTSAIPSCVRCCSWLSMSWDLLQFTLPLLI